MLSTIHRTGQRFGTAHIIDILRGTESQKIERFGHRRLPTFGTGAARRKNDWRSLIRQISAWDAHATSRCRSVSSSSF